MINKAIATRYARALEKICKDKSVSMGSVYEALSSVCMILKENESLLGLLKVSIYPLENKLNILKSISDGVVYSLLSFMASMGRIEFVFDVLDSFSEIMRHAQNKAKATVISTLELLDTEKNTLSDIFTKVSGKVLDFEYVVDKSLMGGIIVEIDGTVYDGSIKTYLTNISNKLNNLNISQGGNG